MCMMLFNAFRTAASAIRMLVTFGSTFDLEHLDKRFCRLALVVLIDEVDKADLEFPNDLSMNSTG